MIKHIILATVALQAATALRVPAVQRSSTKYSLRLDQTPPDVLDISDVQSTITSSPTTTQSKKKEPMSVRIDDTWYDLRGWREAHPAGAHWIDAYKNRDATEVMHAFHSDKARSMFARLPRSPLGDELEKTVPPVTPMMRNFRALRAQLEKDGWWERDYMHEFKLLGMWAGLFFGGLFFAQTTPILATIMLALANTSAGWIGHDYIHGVDKFSQRMRNFAAITAGMSPTWWSDKHNKHHALTNEIGVDEDIATEPLLYVYPPNPKKDSPWRKFQHLYCPAPLSLLFTVWRFDSIKLCLADAKNNFKRGTQQESLFQLIHWAVMFAFVPVPVIAAHIFLSGLITAVIVTVTHQSEEVFDEFQHDFVENQFRTTRNAKCRTPFTSWLWGGMQWQLEHHLFPSMPRSKYPALSPIIQKFAKENNIEYKITDEVDIVKMNWETYRRNALGPAAGTDKKHFEGKSENWDGRGGSVQY